MRSSNHIAANTARIELSGLPFVGAGFKPALSDSMKRSAIHSIRAVFAVLAIALLCALASQAATSGSISGTVKDPSGAVLPGASLILRNTSLGTQYKTTADANGYYSFPNLPVGEYDLTLTQPGFKAMQKSGIVVDMDSALQIDISMELAAQSQSVVVNSTVAAEQVQVETVATHLGEVVSDAQIEALPLNGRSYTDLLAIQPGVSPVTTLTPTSVIMAGVTGTINPSGDLNPGDVSIDGQRESANGFMVDGIDVQEHMNGGTSVIPNLDSIQEFRVLTNNFDPEYGNYNGGMINVVTKSGSNAFHGDAFEFLRNTDLDAKNYFDATRGAFRQNQFGGTVGGPVKKDKIFFFADYQGTRTVEGITSPVTSVPSLAGSQRKLGDVAEFFDRNRQRHRIPPSLLIQQLGYGRSSIRASLITSPAAAALRSACFPTLDLRMSAWSAPAKQSAAIHPAARHRHESFLHLRVSANCARR